VVLLTSEGAAVHPATLARPVRALHVPKAAELLADQIRRQIVRGELVQGELMPPEAELIARWKVGRPALREALRILESESLIKVQRGNVGGAIVQIPSVAAAARAAAVILEVENTPLRDVYDARLALETSAAERAAEVADDSTVRMLQELLDSEEACVDDPLHWAAAAVRFHEGVVQAAGVRTLALFSDMISELIDEHQLSLAGGAPDSAAPDRRLASRSHAKLLRLIRARDVEGARKHWHAHLRDTNARYFDGNRGGPDEAEQR
jgi:DNA-binding FadR family transcriptional regulator